MTINKKDIKRFFLVSFMFPLLENSFLNILFIYIKPFLRIK